MYLFITEPSTTMLLITAIGGLVGAIVWLALYIRKLHNRSMDMSNKFVEATRDLRSSVDANTKALDLNTTTTNDLHKYIITNINGR